MSVTLETNIYVSALEFGGLGARILGMARAGMLQIDISDAILDELVTRDTSSKRHMRRIDFSTSTGRE